MNDSINPYSEFSHIETPDTGGRTCLDLILFLWDDYEGEARTAKINEIMDSGSCPFKDQCHRYQKALKKGIQPVLGFAIPTVKKSKSITKCKTMESNQMHDTQIKMF